MGWFDFWKKPKRDFSGEILSPDGRNKVRLFLRAGKLGYSVERDEKIVIKDSMLGLKIKGDKPIGGGLMLVRMHEKDFSETWQTDWGEAKYIKNNYQEAAFYLAEAKEERRLLTVRFRVFNDGVAFRYEIPAQPRFARIVIAEEMTEFNVDINSYAWHIPAYQPDRYEYNYEKSFVYELANSVHTPLTMQVPTGYYLAIHEAALYDYGSMTIKLNPGYRLTTDITPLSDGMRAYVELPFNTPWRVIMLADAAVGLTINRMLLNLNDPPKEDFSWVKPLKFMGIWWAMFVGEWTWAEGERHGATTDHAMEYIDACKRLGIKGLLIEGWNNGWNGDWLLNGPENNFTQPVADFDIAKVAAYAKEKGVELIGHHETVGFVDNYEKQLEAAYEFDKHYGISYVKSGYAGSRMVINGRKEFHHSQLGVKHYQKALELAAKYHIMLDVHEPIKGTGLERTWPNLLSREGARGQEYEGGALVPSHACILPFTRLLAGGMDYTPGILDVANYTKRMSSTLARQLAYYVTIFSAMQMAADRPRFYEEVHPDAYKFIHDVPVSWEKTVPLLGEIGHFYVVARQERDGEDWYIGGVTNEDPHKVRVSLDFLSSGDYMAEIYRDGEGAHYRDNQLSLKIDSRRVTQADSLDIYMAPGGGFAIRLIKI